MNVKTNSVHRKCGNGKVWFTGENAIMGTQLSWNLIIWLIHHIIL